MKTQATHKAPTLLPKGKPRFLYFVQTWPKQPEVKPSLRTTTFAGSLSKLAKVIRVHGITLTVPALISLKRDRAVALNLPDGSQLKIVVLDTPLELKQQGDETT